MDNIDLIIYINLDSREDRKKEIIEEFKRLNIDLKKVYRFPAIRNEQRPDFGCSASHAKVMEIIMQLPSNIKNVLVLEDDFSFHENGDIVHKSLEKLFERKEDFWDVVLFAYQVKKKKEYDDLLSISLESSTTAGYLIRKEYAPTLLQNIREGIPPLLMTGQHWYYAIDVYWNRLTHTERWFYFNVPLGYQRYSFSDLGKTSRITESKEIM